MEKLKLSQKYKSEHGYPFPDENIDQSLKNEPAYYLAACNAILSKYFNNKCAMPYDAWGARRTIFELRAYRRGHNSPNKYKDLYLGKDAHGRRNKTSLNISWDVLQILPQKIDVVLGYLQKINYDVDVQAIDYQSLVDKKTMVALAKFLADPRIGQLKQEVNMAAGRQVLGEEPQDQMPGGMKFSSPEQVDIAAQVGIFFLQEEAAIQNLLDKTMYESGSDGISDLVKDDLITLAETGKRVYTNPHTNIVMEDWVDIDRAIYPWSKYNDYRDASYAGEVKRYSIARLLKETDITEAKAIEIARMYSTNNGVGEIANMYADIANYRQTGQFGMNMWHQIEVDVFDGVWFGKKSTNVTSIKRKKDGKIAVNLVDDAYELKPKDKNDGKTLDRHVHTTVYKAKMVIGTDFVFDYGEDNDITYNKDINGNLNPILPYSFIRTGSSSLVERCIGFVDDANLANLKLRVARLKMPAPPYVQIDKSALEGMQIDGVKYKPHELMRLLSDEGYLITDSKNQWGNNQSNGRAVTPIGTDLMATIKGWWEDMAMSFQMIEKVTGINDVFAAQTPQRQTGLGVSNLMIQGAQNALTPIIKANEYITEKPWRTATKKWQVVATYLPEEQKKKLSINRSLQVVHIGSKMPERDFDLKIMAANTDEEIAQMTAELSNMKSAARQGGQQSMTESDYLVLGELLRSRKLKQAQLYAAFAVQKRQEEAKQEQQDLIQMNGQQQQQSLQAKGQIDQQNMQLEGQIDTQVNADKIDRQNAFQLKLEQIKGQNERQKLILESQLGLNNRQSA